MKENVFTVQKIGVKIQLAILLFLGLAFLNGCQQEGCTDPLAQNYDSSADSDDGSCTYDTIIPTEICPIVQVNADISSATTWTVGNVYVINSQIAVTGVLTIQPGVIVKLGSNGVLRTNSAGKIIAEGTATNRIVFTSLADDSYCGDSNGDGAATQAQKGDWLNVYLNGGTGNLFRYCDFFYAGANDGGYRCAVLVSVAGASFTFDNCSFAHTQTSSNFTAQFAFYAGSYMSNPAVSVFTNNVFYDNNMPIYCSATYTMNPNNSYFNPANSSQGNTKNCIWMYPDAGSGVNVTYAETEVPYVVDGYVQKPDGTMTIGAGAIIKFPSGNTYGLNVGTLNLSPSAYLTSIKDDSLGGDTNGDGNASVPSGGEWYGYYNWTTSAWVNASNILFAMN